MNIWLSTNLIRDQEINLQLFNSRNVSVSGEAVCFGFFLMLQLVYFPVDTHQNIGEQNEDTDFLSILSKH